MKYATALGIIMVLIITPGRAAESPVDLQSPVNRPIFGCLFETSLGTKKLDECYGLISNRCLDEVAEAGGNLGTRTIRGCAARELASWFDAWVDALEEATWSTLSVDLATGAWTDDLAPTLARFARVQARTAERCLKKGKADSILITDILECVQRAYGPFLVKEMTPSKPKPTPALPSGRKPEPPRPGSMP